MKACCLRDVTAKRTGRHNSSARDSPEAESLPPIWRAWRACIPGAVSKNYRWSHYVLVWQVSCAFGTSFATPRHRGKRGQNFCPRKPGPYWGHGVNPNPPAVASLISESTPIHCGKDATVTVKLADQTCEHPVSLGSRKACLL